MKIALRYFSHIIMSFLLFLISGNNSVIAQGGPYLGQPAPGATPVQFAPDKIPASGVFGFSFSPDGKECVFGHYPPIKITKETNGSWPAPVVAAFSGTYGDVEPHITPDGNRIYFSSERPPSKSRSDLRLWYVDRTESGWSAAKMIEPPLSETSFMYPSVAANGNLYYTGNPGANGAIFVAKFSNGSYQKPERLSDSINVAGMPAHPFIAPDESYLIFDVAVSGYIRDLLICFKKADGTWTRAKNLGSPINTSAGSEMCPFVSRDGKYFFFSRGGTEYWVDASFIEKLRPITGVDYKNSNLSPNFMLHRSYPNPFNAATTIRYELTQTSRIKLAIYNNQGGQVRTLVDEVKRPGSYTMTWDGRDEGGQLVATGVYFYRLAGDDFSRTEKAILLK